MKGAPPLEGHIQLSAEFYKNKPRDITSRNWGDLDNHLKSIKDSMNGICYVDDSQVVRYGHVGKHYGSPRIEVELELIEDEVGD